MPICFAARRAIVAIYQVPRPLAGTRSPVFSVTVFSRDQYRQAEPTVFCFTRVWPQTRFMRGLTAHTYSPQACADRIRNRRFLQSRIAALLKQFAVHGR